MRCDTLKDATPSRYQIHIFWGGHSAQSVELTWPRSKPSVQSLSRVWLFVTPWIAARQASLSITNSRSSLRLTSIESVMPSSHLILCRPLLLLPPIPPSISLFQWVNSSHQVAKVLEFQLQDHSLQRNPRADLLQNGLRRLLIWTWICLTPKLMFLITSASPVWLLQTSMFAH